MANYMSPGDAMPLRRLPPTKAKFSKWQRFTARSRKRSWSRSFLFHFPSCPWPFPIYFLLGSISCWEHFSSNLREKTTLSFSSVSHVSITRHGRIQGLQNDSPLCTSWRPGTWADALGQSQTGVKWILTRCSLLGPTIKSTGRLERKWKWKWSRSVVSDSLWPFGL